MSKFSWMLKGFFLICSILILLSCSKNLRQHEVNRWFLDDGKIKILTTTSMINDIVSTIGADKVKSLSLIANGLDPHSYELVKGDDELLQSAHLILCNGLGLEHGASLAHYLKTSDHAIFLGNDIKKRSPEKIIIIDGAIDPHIWMDISLFVMIIDPIVEQLVEMDPIHERFYRKNGKQLKEKMLQEHERIYFTLQLIEAKNRYLVTSHDAFHYFTRAYLCENFSDEEERKERFIAPEGLSPEMQLSFHDIQKVVDHLQKYQIGVVFPESNVSCASVEKIAQVAREKGFSVEIAEPLYGDSMGDSGYFEMMRYNADMVYNHLKKK